MFSKIESSLSLSKILSGISKSLNIVKEVVPIYEQIKPASKNIKNLIQKVPNITKNFSKKNPIKKTITVSSNSSNPKFFI